MKESKKKKDKWLSLMNWRLNLELKTRFDDSKMFLVLVWPELDKEIRNRSGK